MLKSELTQRALPLRDLLRARDFRDPFTWTRLPARDLPPDLAHPAPFFTHPFLLWRFAGVGDLLLFLQVLRRTLAMSVEIRCQETENVAPQRLH